MSGHFCHTEKMWNVTKEELYDRAFDNTPMLMKDVLSTMESVLSELGGELVKRVLFMGLGIWVAWRFMSNQTNRSAVQNSEAQLASLRPNPAYQQPEDSMQN